MGTDTDISYFGNIIVHNLPLKKFEKLKIAKKIFAIFYFNEFLQDVQGISAEIMKFELTQMSALILTFFKLNENEALANGANFLFVKEIFYYSLKFGKRFSNLQFFRPFPARMKSVPRRLLLIIPAIARIMIAKSVKRIIPKRT